VFKGVLGSTIRQYGQVNDNGQDYGHDPHGDNGLVPVPDTKGAKLAVVAISKPRFQVMKEGKEDDKEDNGHGWFVRTNIVLNHGWVIEYLAK
jgi:hypothetical protein